MEDISYKIGETPLSGAEVDKLISVMANTYFAMLEASGMVMREMERLLEVRGKAFHQKEKQKHSRIKPHLSALKSIIGDLFEDHPDIFKGDWQKWDYWRSDAADVARICLYLYDRTEGSMAKTQQIEEFISSMPEKNKCISKLIEQIKIR